MELLQYGWGFVRAEAGASHADQIVGWVDDALEHCFQYRLDIVEVVSQVFSGLPHLFVCLLFGVGDSCVREQQIIFQHQ